MAALLERLFQLRLHLAAAIAAAVAAGAVYFLTEGPSLSSVVNFFCPLLLSTAFLLAAVAVLLRISPPPHNEIAASEHLVDYVTSHFIGASEAAEDHSIGDEDEVKDSRRVSQKPVEELVSGVPKETTS